ncbi:Fc.00g104370.m01.CDS01 [Cosmosporella sp. VM-42]
MTSNSVLHSLFACTECKARKVRCDRIRPTCGRCVDGGACQYPASRKRPVTLAARPKLRELENRGTNKQMTAVELEDKLKEKELTKRQLPQTPDSRSETSTVTTPERAEESPHQWPPQWQAEELINLYFATAHHDAPMLHPSRYISSLNQVSFKQPPFCLQLVVMALAAGTASEHVDLAEPLYRQARQCIETDEMKEDGLAITLAHAQCWVLLSHFEAQNLWASRASMSTAKAVRLSQILGLHLLDGHRTVIQALPSPSDGIEREERRRTFWSIFITDRGASSTTGLPAIIDVRHIRTRLPAAEESFEAGIEEPSITLKDALHSGTTVSSAFACRVAAMHLFHECFNVEIYDVADTSCSDLDDMDAIPFEKSFHYLDTKLATALERLPKRLQCPINTNDNHAVIVNLQLHTAIICLHRAASARGMNSPQLLCGIQSKVVPAAQAIVTIVALVTNIDIRFRNPFVAFAAFMAAFVFLKEYLTTRVLQHRQKLMALMDVMVAVGTTNPVTASLAVQLAQELQKTGVDTSAMAKVQMLLEKLDLKTPLLGKENHYQGMVLMCPIEARFGTLHG